MAEPKKPSIPSAPVGASQRPRVQSLTAKELKALLDSGEKLEIFDVRTSAEREIAKLAAARHLDGNGQQYLQSLDRGAKLVFQCHHGMRSRAAAERALEAGFTNVYNLEGGIEAWSRDVDPSVPRY